MLLYLASNLKSGLIDTAATEKELNIKKLVGKFSLKSFVTKDMRNYAASQFFVIDADCAEESPEDFCVALQSFQMMFSARIIVILSGCEKESQYTSRLVSVGVVNIVTADTLEAVTDEILECLSDEGMQRYLTRYTYIEDEPVIRKRTEEKPTLEEISIFKWNAKNVKIAVAGAQRRCGATVTAFNFATWLSARGADVCYVEMNMNRHLHMILNVFEAVKEQEHYTIDGLDCYLTDELDRDYNFIIYDCGAMTALPMAFRDADKRLLCGSALPYELAAFNKALSVCGSLDVDKLAVGLPDEMRDYCIAVFGDDLLIADTSHELFAVRKNSNIYLPIVEEYIRE